MAFGKQIEIGCIGLRTLWRCALLNVIEDPADELWIGDVCDDTQLLAAERAAGDVDFEHTLQSLRAGERISVFDGRLCRIELLVCRRGA